MNRLIDQNRGPSSEFGETRVEFQFQSGVLVALLTQLVLLLFHGWLEQIVLFAQRAQSVVVRVHTFVELLQPFFELVALRVLLALLLLNDKADDELVQDRIRTLHKHSNLALNWTWTLVPPLACLMEDFQLWFFVTFKEILAILSLFKYRLSMETSFPFRDHLIEELNLN